MSASQSNEGVDYYALLGVARDAGADEVRRAFRRFALAHHPDNFADDERAAAEQAAARFRRGSAGYRVLMNPSARRAYDARLSGDAPPSELPGRNSTRPPGPSRSVSARARPFFQKAKQAMAAGRAPMAKLNLEIALLHDPDHPELLEAMRQLES